MITQYRLFWKMNQIALEGKIKEINSKVLSIKQHYWSENQVKRKSIFRCHQIFQSNATQFYCRYDFLIVIAFVHFVFQKQQQSNKYCYEQDFNRCTYNERKTIFSFCKCSEKVLSPINCTEVGLFLYYQERWYFFLPKIGFFSLRWKMIFLKKKKKKKQQHLFAANVLKR